MRDYLATQRGIVAAYLFGSAASGTLHRHSDVDVALLLDAGMNGAATLALRLQTAAGLEALCHRRVDVLLLNSAPPALRFEVIRQRAILYETDKDLRCQFEMTAMNEYYDLAPYLTYQLSHLVRRIREEGLGLGYQGHRDALAEARRLSATAATAPPGSTG